MEFGKVQESELNTIDFSLPPKPGFNKLILTGKPADKPVAYMGCAKWDRLDWRGKIYSRASGKKDFLRQYVQHYNSIELNATHYKMYGSDQIIDWAKRAGEKDFKFCPKMNEDVTHDGSLTGKESITNNFLTAIREFKDHLGPVFIQLSESFSPRRKEELFNYLSALPKDVSFFVEVRHPEWFHNAAIGEALFNTLRKLNIGLIITEAAGRRDCVHMTLTVPRAFIRFVGNSLDKTDLTRIDEWANRIKYWLDNGLEELYFFMHMHDEALSPELTVYLAEKLNKACGLDLHIPVMLPKQTELFD